MKMMMMTMMVMTMELDDCDDGEEDVMGEDDDGDGDTKSYLHEVPQSWDISTPIVALASFSSVLSQPVASMASVEPRASKKLKRADAQRHITCQDSKGIQQGRWE